MSTRANIIIKSGIDQLIFYRHSDGYPEGVAQSLNTFMHWLKDGKIRRDLMQSAGWLIILGASEYNYNHDFNDTENYNKPLNTPINEYVATGGISGWKVGAYEPTTQIHGDIEFIYEIDLDNVSLKGWSWDWKTDTKFEQIEIPN